MSPGVRRWHTLARSEPGGLTIRLDERRGVVLAILLTLILCALSVFLTVQSADARKVTWHKAGASFYGGPSDASSGCTGYRGDNLCGWKWRSWAELGMGCSVGRGALGGLPYRAKIRVLYRHRKITLVKRDCGLGGGRVGGLPRAIDIWHRAAAYLRIPGLAVVQWRRVG